MVFPFNIKTSKCRGSCNSINYPYAKICVKVFNLMSRTNETRHVEWHEMCKCDWKCGANVWIIHNVGIKINADVNAKN